MRRNLASEGALAERLYSNVRRAAAHSGLSYSSIDDGPGLEIAIPGGVFVAAGASIVSGTVVIDQTAGGRITNGDSVFGQSSVSVANTRMNANGLTRLDGSSLTIDVGLRVENNARVTGTFFADVGSFDSSVAAPTVNANDVRFPWRDATWSIGDALTAVRNRAVDAESTAGTALSRANQALDQSGNAVTQSQLNSAISNLSTQVNNAISAVASDLSTLRTRFNNHTTHPPGSGTG